MTDDTSLQPQAKPLSDLPLAKPHEEKVKGGMDGAVEANRLTKEQLRAAQAVVSTKDA